MVDVDAKKDHRERQPWQNPSGQETRKNARAAFFPSERPHFHLCSIPMSSARSKPENPLLNLLCNIVVPTVVLLNLSSERRLGPLWALVAALIFPIGYGLYDFTRRKKTNLLSILGFVSVLVSGSLALLQLGGIWFAVKDAALPTLIGVFVLASLRSKNPLVRELFYNEQILDVPRIDAALAARGERDAFERLLRRTSVALALTFIASAPVNFLLALRILRSPPGTPEFNLELGKMHWLAPLVIAVPSMIVMMLVFWKLIGGLTRLTGLTQDEIFRTEPKTK
jgi:hypothetical protein